MLALSVGEMDPFYLALLLYCVALVVAFVDLFVPSGGMLLIMATAAAFGAILFGFRSGTTMGMAMLTIVVASVPAFAYAAIKIWPNTPLGKRIILSLPSVSAEAVSNNASPRNALVGVVIEAESPLMPTGQVRVGHRHYNAVVESGIIEAGQNVEIIGFKERNLVVRVTDAAPTRLTNENKQSETESPQRYENLLDLPADELGLDSLDT